MRCELLPRVSLDADVDLLVVGVPAGEPPLLPEALRGALGPGLEALVAREKFTGRADSSLSVPLVVGLPARRLLLVGLGDGRLDDLRGAAGAAGMAARAAGAATVAMDLSAASAGPGAVEAMVEGFAAGNYRFDRYRAEKSRKAPCEVLSLAGDPGAAAEMARARVVAEAQALVRDLVNEPADVIHPEGLAEAACRLASDTLTVEVWDDERIRDEGMGGIYAVGKGSQRPPRFVHMHYKPAGDVRASLALVGKGVTFDAGGLSLKPADGMDTMRCDMAGAATVIGAMQAIDRLQPPVEVHGIFAAAENLPSGSAYKLGDVLRMFNGKTVEIHNTDAEGRLLLADCLVYASRLGVEACLDLATLTGACVVALGSRYTGLFTEDDALAGELQALADAAGDGLWRLPLAEHFKKLLEAEWADLNHVGPRWGGASSAAAFLSEFVDGPRWAHLDIAGPAFMDKPERYYGKGATGAMLRTVVRWVLAR